MSVDRPLASSQYKPLEDIAQRATRIAEELATLDKAYYKSRDFLKKFIDAFDRKLIPPKIYRDDWEIAGSCRCTPEFLNPTIPEIIRQQLGYQRALFVVRNATRNTGVEVDLTLDNQNEPFAYNFAGIRSGPWFGYGEGNHFEELKALYRKIDLSGPLAAYFFFICGSTLERAIGHQLSESPQQNSSGLLE